MDGLVVYVRNEMNVEGERRTGVRERKERKKEGKAEHGGRHGCCAGVGGELDWCSQFLFLKSNN